MSKYYTSGGRAPSPSYEFEDRQGGGRGGNGGYNDGYGEGGYSSTAMQPLHSPLPPQPGFDVRADFDGNGPRWSEMYGIAKHEKYRPVYDHVAPEGDVGGYKEPNGGLQHAHDPEMVSVPVLGPEWTKNELHNQTRRGKHDIKTDKRKASFRAWSRDQRGCCGIPWLTRKVFVFIAFFFIAALIVTLYFTIPRAAVFELYHDQPFAVDNGTIYFQRMPQANFSFSGDLQMIVDGSASYLPIQFSNAQAKVFDTQTNKIIATGNLGHYRLNNKKDQAVRLPVKFSYSAFNFSDPTWANMYNGCQYPWPGVNRTVLQWSVEIRQSIVGLVNHPVVATAMHDIACPFEVDKNV